VQWGVRTLENRLSANREIFTAVTTTVIAKAFAASYRDSLGFLAMRAPRGTVSAALFQVEPRPLLHLEKSGELEGTYC